MTVRRIGKPRLAVRSRSRRSQDAPPGLHVGEVLYVDDPQNPLCGRSFPIVRVMRCDRRWAAVVQLPNGLTRRVLIREGHGEGHSVDNLPARTKPPPLDLRVLWERRKWIRSLVAQLEGAAVTKKGEVSARKTRNAPEERTSKFR